MKIVHVIPALTKGGGQRVAVELANTAVQKGDEVSIITGWPVNPSYLQNIIRPEISVRFIGQSRWPAYLKMIPWIIKYRKWIFSHDVMHCHLTYAAVFGSIARIILKLIFRKVNPVIVETYHAVGMPIPKFNRWIHSRLMLFRDGVVFMGKDPYWKKFIQEHPGVNTSIIPNGMSVEVPGKRDELKQKFCTDLGIPVNYSFIVGTVGMLRPERKPELYIPIFQAINKDLGNDVHYILAGGGDEFDKIKMLVEESGLKENIHMPGTVNKPVFTIFNMDIYVSVSVGETAGISMIEAAMCKVPVVGIQFVENYQAKKEDWVWSHTDTKEVAKRIIHLLQNTDERNMLAAFQYEYVNKHFSSEAMYASYNSFYKQIKT